MVVTSHLIFDPIFHIRIATVALVAATLIGVVVSRSTDKSSSFIRLPTVVRSDISIGLDYLEDVGG
jgi:hypothetical protein